MAIRFIGRGQLTVPGGKPVRYGEVVPQEALKAMGDNRRSRLMAEGILTEKDILIEPKNKPEVKTGRGVQKEKD